jgi:holliday junction DNA helicase RuvB
MIHPRHFFPCGPAGIETIAAALSEPRDAIEDIIEPFLIQRRHLGLAEPAHNKPQLGLFAEEDREEHG